MRELNYKSCLYVYYVICMLLTCLRGRFFDHVQSKMLTGLVKTRREALHCQSAVWKQFDNI